MCWTVAAQFYNQKHKNREANRCLESEEQDHLTEPVNWNTTHVFAQIWF